MTPAQSLQEPATRANECPGLARACTAAARELVAAQKLIADHRAHIAAADERITIARKEIASLKELGQLERQRANELEAVIKSERAAKAAMMEKITLQEKRIAKLEKSAGRWRKLALITGVAAGVGILIAIGK